MRTVSERQTACAQLSAPYFVVSAAAILTLLKMSARVRFELQRTGLRVAGPASESQDSMYFDAEDELPASPSGSDGDAHGTDLVAAFSASLSRLTKTRSNAVSDRVCRNKCLTNRTMCGVHA